MNRWCWLLAWGLCQASLTASERERMVEIDYQGGKRIGTVILHNAHWGWFLERDGRLEPIALDAVSRYRPLGRFEPWSLLELREQLGREFGGEFRVTSTEHYLVVVPAGARDDWAKQFEALYRQFVVVFSARGFSLRAPRFPLVAVVLPHRAAFERFCQRAGVTASAELRGFYLPSSNRVVLYDPEGTGGAASGGLHATVIHEATHQVAYNVGLHSRVKADPKWVVEGLATVFEREAVRLNDRRGPIWQRVHPERYGRFQHVRVRRWSPERLKELLGSDDWFETEPLDAYATAWALSFYLLERLPVEYGNYLRKLSQRDPWEDDTAEQRLRDFQAVFGRDLSAFEQGWLRYYRELAAREANE